MRLDKYVTLCTGMSRKEAKGVISSRRITVNDESVNRPEFQVKENDIIMLSGDALSYQEYEYYMLNKPSGVVSATTDNRDTTVVDILDGVSHKELFPVGRLDKDTEGLLILTNDGALAHRLLSPKHHVDKVYEVSVDEELTSDDVEAFEQGMDIGEKRITMPAKLQPLSQCRGLVTIREGKFHQIKRMFEHQGKKVIGLKRIQMGSLVLDENLPTGAYRSLTDAEIASLKGME